MQKLLKGSTFRPINIYALIHPISKHPFYVGVTIGILAERLKGHVLACLHDNRGKLDCSHCVKSLFVQAIVKDFNVWPEIALITQCNNIHEAEFKEKFFYSLLLSQGYTLYNDPKRFQYGKQYFSKKSKNKFAS